MKSAVYARPTAEELSVVRGTDADKRAAVIKAKLVERRALDV